MSLESVPGLIQTYGRDVILLISGSLHAQGTDLVENVRRFRKTLETAGSIESDSSS